MSRIISRAGSIILYFILFFNKYAFAQKANAQIVLVNEPLSVTSGEYYVAGVVDERDEHNAVAWLLPTEANVASAKTPVDFKSGGLNAIKQFINQAIPAGKGLRPVIIRIKKFRLDETLNNGRVDGRIRVSLSFDLQKGEDNVHLIDYNGGATYSRPANQQLVIEPAMRHALEYGLTYFNTWINNEANTNVKLAKGTKIILSDYTEKPEGDTIYYSPKRPLTWDDFKGIPPASKFTAEVFPGFGYNEQVDVVKGIIIIKLTIKVYLPKSAAWVKDGARSDYSLNHEQKHFDIVKIIAERFKQKLQTEQLPVDNFDGYINVDYLDLFREMDAVQKQYDTETSHGTNPYQQQLWNEKVEKGSWRVVNFLITRRQCWCCHQHFSGG